jgi:hypothetical protein
MSMDMDIKVPDAAEAKQVSRAIVKALFRGGLPADKEYLAHSAITGALVKWREQIEARYKSELEDARREAADEKMRADEAELRIASVESER